MQKTCLRCAHSASPNAGRPGNRSGQALIESCIVILLLCLICFGLLQISRLFAAQEIMDYAASRGARARTVGFNQFMVFKAVRVGTIPSAGLLSFPSIDGGPSAQQDVEEARIPLYLGAERHGNLSGILDYELWDDVEYSHQQTGFGDQVDFQVYQDIPFTFPLHQLYYAGDSLEIRGEASMEKHFPLYLQDLEL